MIRNRILAATAIIAAVVLTACSDMTAPKSNACPVTGGSQTCAARLVRRDIADLTLLLLRPQSA